MLLADAELRELSANIIGSAPKDGLQDYPAGIRTNLEVLDARELEVGNPR